MPREYTKEQIADKTAYYEEHAKQSRELHKQSQEESIVDELISTKRGKIKMIYENGQLSKELYLKYVKMIRADPYIDIDKLLNSEPVSKSKSSSDEKLKEKVEDLKDENKELKKHIKALEKHIIKMEK